MLHLEPSGHEMTQESFNHSWPHPWPWFSHTEMRSSHACLRRGTACQAFVKLCASPTIK